MHPVPVADSSFGEDRPLSRLQADTLSACAVPLGVDRGLAAPQPTLGANDTSRHGSPGSWQGTVHLGRQMVPSVEPACYSVEFQDFSQRSCEVSAHESSQRKLAESTAVNSHQTGVVVVGSGFARALDDDQPFVKPLPHGHLLVRARPMRRTRTLVLQVGNLVGDLFAGTAPDMAPHRSPLVRASHRDVAVPQTLCVSVDRGASVGGTRMSTTHQALTWAHRRLTSPIVGVAGN